MVDTSCNDFLELYFQEMTEQPLLTQIIELFSILSKKSFKIKKYQVIKIYNSKNCNRNKLYTLN